MRSAAVIPPNDSPRTAPAVTFAVLTLGVGGCYLGYLLVSEHRKGRL